MKLLTAFSLVSVIAVCVYSAAVPTKPDNCVVTSADVGFVIDASGSVDANEWKKSLEFATNVVKGFDIGPNQVRVGLISFSSASTLVFDFKKYTTQAQIIAAMNNAPKQSSTTNTHLGLNMANNQLFTASSGMRPGVPSILFVITDGESNVPAQTAASAKTLHRRNITVFAVGVSGAKEVELKAIASGPTLVYSFQDFNKLVQLQESFRRETCKVVEKLAPTTTPRAPPRPTPNSGCSVNGADMVFVVDTSTSVGEDNFNLTKAFLFSMMERLDFTKTRVGLIKFNDKVSTEFELNENNNLVGAQRSVDLMTYDKGKGTVISAAVKYMREHSFTVANGDRPTVPNIGILLTDGQAADAYRTQYEANLTKEMGVELFAVGVGDQINQQELESLASDPSFVYLVKTYNVLASIRDILATKLCQGFTVPPPTTLAPCVCKDAEANCRGYGIEMCTQQHYRAFALKTCPVFCGLCEPRCIQVTPPPRKCVDIQPNCPNLINVCSDPGLKPYALANCPRYCNLCNEINPTNFVQPITTPTTTPTTTTTTTTRAPATRPPTPPKPTTFVPCDINCYDKARDCEDYDKNTCQDARYVGFFRGNCAAFCGFCTPKPACIPTERPCVDIEDCSRYEDSACSSYPVWAKNTCPQRCGYCGTGPIVVGTTPSIVICEDIEPDCDAYGKDMCTDFAHFASTKCRRHCGYCVYTGPTTTVKCVDKRDCSGYQKTDCTNPDFRKFMLAECRVFCNLCGVSE